MKSTTLILTMAVAVLLSLGGASTASRAFRPKGFAETAPQEITVMYSDVPVSLSVNSFQMPFDLAALTY